MVNCGERWIDAEVDFLREHFHHGLEYCAAKLGRTIPGIRKRAYKLGLIKSTPPRDGYRKGLRREWRERARCSI